MNANNINKVAIVGGGTAGWMAATALSKFFGKKIEIVLIESDEISTVGVGEATIPPIKFFNQLLGLKADELMRDAQGTFKLAIQFENWGQIGDTYMHTFDRIGYENTPTSFHHYWLRAKKNGDSSDYWDYSLNRQSAISNKFDLFEGNPQTRLEYAYHFDASLYAKYLRKVSSEFGARRIEGTITKVNTDSKSGNIVSVDLASGLTVAADLFIDCSGFRGLLIEQTLKTGYEDWSHWLPCDRAIAVQSKSIQPPVPFTRSIAHAAGWQWQIPLQHRVGNGLVYCSRFISDDDAEELLLANISGATITKPRIIKFETGRRLKAWNKNCIALGLASGFLEPLESTSIHLIQSGILRLLKLFPTRAIDQETIDQYNRESKQEYEQIRDFIILHYHATERTDSPFWNYCRTMEIPESLKHKMNLFKASGLVVRENNELFQEGSWQQVMLGQRLLPESYHPIVDMMDDAQLELLLSTLKTEITNSVNRFSTHQQFINEHCKARDMD